MNKEIVQEEKLTLKAVEEAMINLFSETDRLTEKQIKSYFSRLNSSKQKTYKTV
jgi:hypothetical protein